MSNKPKWYFLNYSVPILAIVVVIIHFFFVNTHQLSKWKGGGFGMYTDVHYFYNEVYVRELSADSILKKHVDIKNAFSRLILMTNATNLEKAAQLVLEHSQKDSITLQVWKPLISAVDNSYSRTLITELKLTK